MLLNNHRISLIIKCIRRSNCPQTSRKAKSEVTQSTTNVSGTQTYQDPTQVQPKQDTQSTTYDASLDEMSTYNEISSNQKQQSLSTDDANQNQTNSVTKINKKKQMI